MDCPCCGTELVYHDSYGRFSAHQDGHKAGDIYHCPRGRADYIDGEELAEGQKPCDSASFHVGGCWYTDDRGELHEGYPC